MLVENAYRPNNKRLDYQVPLDRFRRLLCCRTVSSRIDEPDCRQAFDDMFSLLPDLFPTIAAQARVTASPPYRLVIQISGNNPSLRPLLVVAHYDVVDAPPEGWSRDPFGGEVVDGEVYGRGAIDDKGPLCAALEAAERLLAAGIKPGHPAAASPNADPATGTAFSRGLVFAFGGDEELTGALGAATTAAAFDKEGRRFHAVVDEGGIVSVGMLANPPKPIALIGVAEKGFVNIEITAFGDEGHASMPPPRTAVGLLAEAVRVVERNPHQTRMLGSIEEFFRAIAPHATGPLRFVYKHPRLFRRVILSILTKKPASAAIARTTQAVTRAHGSEAANVLPQQARAVVNVRILPGESINTVLARYRRLLRRLHVTIDVAEEGGASEPVPESSTEHSTYQTMVEALATVHPDAIAAPFLVTGSTDSKYFAHLAGGVYRIAPIRMTSRDISMVHGTDERISVDEYLKLVRFYQILFEKECLGG